MRAQQTLAKLSALLSPRYDEMRSCTLGALREFQSRYVEKNNAVMAYGIGEHPDTYIGCSYVLCLHPIGPITIYPDKNVPDLLFEPRKKVSAVRAAANFEQFIMVLNLVGKHIREGVPEFQPVKVEMPQGFVLRQGEVNLELGLLSEELKTIRILGYRA